MLIPSFGKILYVVLETSLKTALIFCAGYIAEKSGKTRVSELKGLGMAYPVVFVYYGIASLGTTGMLPLNGFWSKYYLIQGSAAIGSWSLIVVFLLSGLLNAVYSFPITVNAFTDTAGIKREPIGVRGTLMLTTIMALVGIAVLLCAIIAVPFLGTLLLKQAKTQKNMAWISGIISTIVLAFSVIILRQNMLGINLVVGDRWLQTDMLSSMFSFLSAFVWWLLASTCMNISKQKNVHYYFIASI